MLCAVTKLNSVDVRSLCVWAVCGRMSLPSVCVCVELLFGKDMTMLFDVYVTVHRGKFLIIKPTRCTNFSDLFLE